MRLNHLLFFGKGAGGCDWISCYSPYSVVQGQLRPVPYSKETRRGRRLIFGGDSARAPPVPIPNTEVKPRSADGTANFFCGRVGHRRILKDPRPQGRGSFFLPPFFCHQPPAAASERLRPSGRGLFAFGADRGWASGDPRVSYLPARGCVRARERRSWG